MHKYLGALLIIFAIAGIALAQGIGIGSGVNDVIRMPGTGSAAPADLLTGSTFLLTTGTNLATQ